MKILGKISLAIFVLGGEQAYANRIVECEKRSGFEDGCARSLSIDYINKFQSRYVFVQRSSSALGDCSDFETSGVVFRSHYYQFENDQVEIAIDTLPSSNAFLTVFLKERHQFFNFQQAECKSIFN